MKQRQRIISAVLLALLVDLSWAGVALAQDGEEVSDLLSRVTGQILGITNNFLDIFVAGNILTEAKGE